MSLHTAWELTGILLSDCERLHCNILPANNIHTGKASLHCEFFCAFPCDTSE